MANKLTLDPSRWSYQQYADFLNHFMRANWEKALPLVMDLVVAWTYDVPLGPDAYLELEFSDLPEIVQSVNDTLKAYIEGLDAGDVSVRLGNWKMRDFLRFREAGKSGNVKELEDLMRKVCLINDAKLGERLTFEQGALMVKALNATTKDMFSTGK